MKEYEIPVDSYAAVADIQSYIEAGNYKPALEYISQVKGADCPAICSGTCIRTDDSRKRQHKNMMKTVQKRQHS